LNQDIIVNKMQENMLENTRQIINFKNLVNQTTDEHHKLTKDFEEEKERNKKSNSCINKMHKFSTSRSSTNSTRSSQLASQMGRSGGRISAAPGSGGAGGSLLEGDQIVDGGTSDSAVPAPRRDEPGGEKADKVEQRTGFPQPDKDPGGEKERVPGCPGHRCVVKSEQRIKEPAVKNETRFTADPTRSYKETKKRYSC
jgi:hypothetical protein